MQLQEIAVVIGPTGEVSIEVLGVAGMSCTVLTHELEQALGGQGERTLKPEAFEEAVAQRVEQSQRG
ncbi:MAG: DUF2997 domain-containing protein [Candidatus Sericytochromatia bacterium]|nr:DUF2997 domain-containing protein [Candidatus Tanganyikabacteria bacterium]